MSDAAYACLHDGLCPAASQAVALTIITISKDDAIGLAATIRSILAQTFTAFELLVVRSGTSQQLAMPKDDRVVVVDVVGTGISAAFNMGLARATGEWVQFLNGGDVFATPTDLAALVAAVRPGLQMVMSFARVEGHSFTIPRRALRFGRDGFLYASHQATLFRRELFVAHGNFSTRYAIRMDLEWLSRLPQSTAFVFVPLETVRFEAAGLSASSVVRSSTEEVRVLWTSKRHHWRAVRVLLLVLPFRVMRRAWRVAARMLRAAR